MEKFQGSAARSLDETQQGIVDQYTARISTLETEIGRLMKEALDNENRFKLTESKAKDYMIEGNKLIKTEQASLKESESRDIS